MYLCAYKIRIKGRRLLPKIVQVSASKAQLTKRAHWNLTNMGWQWEQCPWKRFPYIQVSDVLCYKPIPIITNTINPFEQFAA